ncbi:MAG: carbohydrate ABC transporter permease [Caldilineaceae bacterium]|nr:carbohydrate ABC transporter permease [Caldilineaceae bacterium]
MVAIIKRNFRLDTLLVNLSLLLIVVICLLPFVWSVSSSLKGRDELFQTLPSLLPKDPTLGNYYWIFTRRDMSMIPINMFNSFKVTLLAVVIQTSLATMAGYAFARLEFKGRDLMFYGLILLIFVPRAGGLMAVYELMDFLNLRNSHIGLALLFSSAMSTAVFIMRQNFLNIPRELEESAIIEGANTWQVFLYVAAPLARGGMVVVALFEFLYVWGEYLMTRTLIDFPELETLSVAVAKISGWAALFTSSAFSTYGSEAAAHVVAMTPVIIIFILMQRWFIRGLTEGVLKM